ncbi:hypothetical protein L6164_025109 [Bauhinia variegata]|uniref:Uncharacterized protein n=1 Tax=Bauhinia variegata TaxID=167791 RepID=A0ACB9LZB8_BAUVA|nr:hypothetical protein L6164_025109 [Bauhinia variegata]
MIGFSELFSQLYTKIVVFLTLRLLKLVLLIGHLMSDTQTNTTTQFLKLIEERNPTICFTRRLKPPDNIDQCRVCLSEFEEGEKVRNLKCKHTFHKDCLDKWLQQCLATCPLCRNQVLPDNVVDKYRRLRNQVENDQNEDQIMTDYVICFTSLLENCLITANFA